MSDNDLLVNGTDAVARIRALREKLSIPPKGKEPFAFTLKSAEQMRGALRGNNLRIAHSFSEGAKEVMRG